MIGVCVKEVPGAYRQPDTIVETILAFDIGVPDSTESLDRSAAPGVIGLAIVARPCDQREPIENVACGDHTAPVWIDVLEVKPVLGVYEAAYLAYRAVERALGEIDRSGHDSNAASPQSIGVVATKSIPVLVESKALWKDLTPPNEAAKFTPPAKRAR